jgi:ribonucleoside-diphosphate reductase alpha chain
MWKNRDTYSGIAVLPYHGGNYKQTPFEDCTEEQYNEMSKHLAKIDLTLVSENENNVNLQAELACQGNNCEVL